MTRALRESLAAKGVGGEDGFRLRGGEISRLEGFSDAVFAFAVTLLVVSLEVPRTFNELANVMRGFPAFAVCFTLLIVIWQEHYVFFRRYGLQNGVILWLNAALLFVMLFYVYPLKFLFTIVLAPLTGTPMVVAGAHGGSESVIEPSQLPQLFLIYGAGIIALYVLLACLFVHAYRRRRALALTPLEEFDTRASIRSHFLAAGVAAVSIVIALVVPLHLVGLAGWAYFLFGPVMAIHGSWTGRKRRRLGEGLGLGNRRAFVLPPQEHRDGNRLPVALERERDRVAPALGSHETAESFAVGNRDAVDRHEDVPHGKARPRRPASPSRRRSPPEAAPLRPGASRCRAPDRGVALRRDAPDEVRVRGPDRAHRLAFSSSDRDREERRDPARGSRCRPAARCRGRTARARADQHDHDRLLVVLLRAAPRRCSAIVASQVHCALNIPFHSSSLMPAWKLSSVKTP